MKKLLVASLCFLFFSGVAAPSLAAQPDYGHYRGYHRHPYETNRHYNRFDYRGHPYVYRGHWRSWNDWNAFRRHSPGIYRDGRYYRDHGHLMFRYCDPHGGGCFFFSIGR